MSVEVNMPKFGATMETGEISKWLKAVGDKVEKGEPIAEITTEKITNDVEAPVSGIVESLLFEEGESAEIGAIIATIRE